MIKVSDTKLKDTEAVLKRAIVVAEHFGFTPRETALLAVESSKVTTDAVRTVHAHEKFYLSTIKHFAERARFLRSNQALTYELHLKATGKSQPAALTLHVAGVKKGIAEATLIAAAKAIMKEIGIDDTVVKMSSYGNLDSAARYNRDLTLFLKKTLGPATTAGVAKEVTENPRRVFAKFVIDRHPSTQTAPNPMDYLNDDARAHMRSVLEYLESSDIPYELDSKIIGSEDVFDQTFFEIHRKNEDGTTDALAHGGRMNVLGRKAHKQQIDTAGLVITCDVQGSLNGLMKPAAPKTTAKKVRFYFAHISDEAKKLTLKVLQTLFDSGIAANHLTTRETLGEQMGTETARAATHVIIIGHKEAVDGVAIVREVNTRAQKTVPLTQLGSYLKKVQG
jgi:histidyl-tRNA synthetase